MLETAQPTGYFTLLFRRRNFALLWLSGLLAYFAIWTSNIVVLDVVNDAMHSDVASAVILIVQFLPAFFLMPLAGRILDRYDRRHVLLASKLCSAALTMMLLFWSSALPVGWIIVIYTLSSISTTMFIIGEGALLPLVVARADLMRANILLRISPCLMLVLSAGFVAEREIGINHQDEFLLVAVLFLASAAVFSRIRRLRWAETDVSSRGEGLLREFLGGMGYLFRHRELAQVFAMRMALYVGVGGQVLLSVYSEEFYKLGDSGTGILYMARGLGLLIGSFALAPLVVSKGVRSVNAIRFGLALFGLGYLLGSALAGFGIGTVAVLLGFGFLGEGLLKPITMALLQERTDAVYLARVLAAEQGLSAVVQSAAAMVIATCVTDVPATVLWASAATGGLLIVIAWCVKLSRDHQFAR
jgi:Na+/melibiose symporter-like transporter